MTHAAAHYDIIIAGGGPAGSTAAYLLSRAGLNVLIIDKSRFPRKKLCGGLITDKTVKLLERVLDVTVDTLNQHGIIDYESDHYEIYGRKRLITERKFNIPFRFIDRESYDNFLLKKALQAGASLVEGDGVQAVDILRSSIKTRGGRDFTADVIIGADGINSRIRRSFAVDLFGREDWTENVASAHEVIISRDRIKHQVDHPALYFGPVTQGYAWIFPNRDTVTAGICGLKDKTGMSILSAFRQFLGEMDLTSAGDERIHSYVLPYGCYLPSPVFRNIVLIGDAAGFADPLWGEGIYYAQRSAELAAQAIINMKDNNGNVDDMKEYYLSMLNNDILIELEYAEKIRKTIFRYYKIFDFFLLSKIMNMNADKPIEMIHGLRSYKWMKKM